MTEVGALLLSANTTASTTTTFEGECRLICPLRGRCGAGRAATILRSPQAVGSISTDIHYGRALRYFCTCGTNGLSSTRCMSPWRPTGRILRYLAGSLGQGMAGKIVELRAVLLFSGAVCLVHSGTERKALIRAMPSSKRRNLLKQMFLA